MDAETLTKLISTLGFPIVCVIFLGYFSFYMVKRTNEQACNQMKEIQDRAIEREKVLYEEVKINREANAQAMAIISKYAGKLDTIQNDIADIKDDILVIKTQQGK